MTHLSFLGFGDDPVTATNHAKTIMDITSLVLFPTGATDWAELNRIFHVLLDKKLYA